MKKTKKQKCTCGTGKPTNILQASCDVFNHYLRQIHALKEIGFFKEGLNMSEVHAQLGTTDYFQEVVFGMYGTLDGKPNDLESVVKFCHYMLTYHIERGDISTIDHVKVKLFENGQKGWTSCHFPQ